MATDLENLVITHFARFEVIGMAGPVADAIEELRALRAQVDRLRAELAACREALRLTEGPSSAQQPRPE